VKIDGNSILRNAQGGADSKRFEGNFKAALLRAGGGRASTATPGPTIRQNSALRLLNDASQVPAPRALAPLLENFVAINAGGAGSDSKTNFWYQVRKGDTLSGIVKSKLKSLDQLAAPQAIVQLTKKIAQLNRISNADLIVPGQKVDLGYLEFSKGSINEFAKRPVFQRSAELCVTEATACGVLDLKNAIQGESLPSSNAIQNAKLTVDDDIPSQTAGSHAVINTYLPDQAQEPLNSPATITLGVNDAATENSSPLPETTTEQVKNIQRPA